MYDRHMEVVGELLPGLIRLGTITSDHFDDSIHGLVVFGFATEQFLGHREYSSKAFFAFFTMSAGRAGKVGRKSYVR